MKMDFVSDELAPARAEAAAPREIRISKPEEGEARGELLHLIRALLLVVGATALIGWLVS